MSAKTLLIKNDKSRFEAKAQQKREDAAMYKEFEKKADTAIAGLQKDLTGMDIIPKIVECLRDKTLPENKGALKKNYEIEIRNEWKKFVVEKDNDENDPMINTGTHAAIILIMKILFEQRDRINDLEFKLSKLQKE